MPSTESRCDSLRTLLSAIIVLVVSLTTVEVRLNAQLRTGTNPPCVLTAGYAGPATDASFNSRQSINPYETTFSPTSVGSLTTTGTLFEVDDQLAQLPTNATSNPIMVQPLYVTGISVSSPANTANCNNNTTCNMLIAATLNSTVFAWVADGTNAGKLLWNRQGTPTGTSGNALWYDDCGNGGGPVSQNQVLQFDGILSTPVIDASGSPPVMYLTSFCQTSAGARKWFLHEINLQTGQDIVSARDIGQDVGSSFSAKWQQQRPALLLAKNSNNSRTSNLIYILFGTNVPEWTYSKGYTGWLAAYTVGSGGSLTLKFAYSNEPTGCGMYGGLTDAGASNGQCNFNPNSGSPSCDCYTFPTGPTAPNWGGHGGGCWSSGNGPAATTAGAINSDSAVHVFFGCGNGGFQEFNGSSRSASNNNGSTIMDFRLTSSGFDSNSTGAFQTFTPNSPAAGVGPTAATKCGCDSNGQYCNTCSYTYQTLNAYDWDPAVSGVALFNDLGGTPRAVVVDKAGYGYLLTQGQLCGSGFTLDTACVGFDPGDPGSWTFGAAKTFCTSNPEACDRVTSMAVYDNYINHTPGSGHAVHIVYWPNHERLTEVQVSDNSTAVSGVSGQTLTWTSGSSTTLNLASCTTDVNCLGDQITPGDTLALTGTGCSCTGGTCPTVTSVTDNGTGSSLTISSSSVSAGYGTSCTSGSGFTYTGWLVTPAHDSTPGVSAGGFPGGAVMLSANCTGLPSTACYHGLIWAIPPGSDSTSDTLDRGLGTLYAYRALPNSSDILGKEYNSSDTWCASSFARPTIVNASAFVPTYATSCPSGKSGCRQTQTFTNCKSSGTGSIGDGNGPYPSGVLRYN